MKVSSADIYKLKTRGWTLISMGFKEEAVERYKRGVEELRDKAIKINYPLRRCYYPHLTNDNIAAIESPFNKLISNEIVKELFINLKLGNTIKELMGWEKVYLHLARLFTMRNYKYIGKWHRDFEGWNGNISEMNTIQVAIYLKDQDGFRIVKPNFDFWGKSNNRIKEDKMPDTFLPLTLPKTHYYEIEGKAGYVLFFAPGLMHQGNSQCERLDFHFRFSNSRNIFKLNPKSYFYEKTNKNFPDFELPSFYSENFDIKMDQYSPRSYAIKNRTRLLNSINYYTSIINILRYLKNSAKGKLDYSNPWKGINLLSNTIYQN